MTEVLMQTCNKCGLTKPITEFHKAGKNGYRHDCKTCRNKAARTKYAKMDENKRKERRLRTGLKYRHNLTVEEFNKLNAAQKGKCAICGKPADENLQSGRTARLYVDHDHNTGKIRGLLCNACNRGLGFFRDNPNFLRSAIKYLEEGGSK